jgi:hypothetical protein
MIIIISHWSWTIHDWSWTIHDIATKHHQHRFDHDTVAITIVISIAVASLAA